REPSPCSCSRSSSHGPPRVRRPGTSRETLPTPFPATAAVAAAGARGAAATARQVPPGRGAARTVPSASSEPGRRNSRPARAGGRSGVLCPPTSPPAEGASPVSKRQGGHRRIDRVLAPEYGQNLSELSLPEVKGRRDESLAEREYQSLLRRLVQGRLDILRAEQTRRAAGEEE